MYEISKLVHFWSLEPRFWLNWLRSKTPILGQKFKVNQFPTKFMTKHNVYQSLRISGYFLEKNDQMGPEMTNIDQKLTKIDKY